MVRTALSVLSCTYVQADYYETGTWLSEEEKKDMDEAEQRRRDARKPSNRKFKMTFDMAGRLVLVLVIRLV